MLLKRKGTDNKELKKMALENIKLYVKPNEEFCYIPYLDVELAEIKYLKLKRVNKKWVFI